MTTSITKFATLTAAAPTATTDTVRVTNRARPTARNRSNAVTAGRLSARRFQADGIATIARSVSTPGMSTTGGRATATAHVAH